MSSHPPQLLSFPSTSIAQRAATQIATTLATQLHEHSVLLLLSGGSALPMYKAMFQLLVEKTNDLTQLTVSLFDERFVLKGSADSNEQQLKVIGILDLLKKHHAH